MTDETDQDNDAGDEAGRFDAGQQHSVETRNKRARRRQREYDDALTEMLKLRPCRVFIWAQLSRAHIFATSYADHGTPERTAFREGERNVGLQLLHDVMRVDPDAFALMQREAAQDAKP